MTRGVSSDAQRRANAKWRQQNKAKQAAYAKAWQQKNKAKQAAYMKIWNAENVGSVFEALLRSKYGIDTHDWALMYEEQKGRCGICANKLTLDHKTHVDHCHMSGYVRELLCARCNVALGALEKVGVHHFAAYLERWRTTIAAQLCLHPVSKAG